MLYCNGIGVSEGIDINETSALKEFDICHNMYFSGKVFNFQPDVFNGCHDVLIISMKLSNVAVLNIYVETKLLHCCKFITKVLFKRTKWNTIKAKNLLSLVKHKTCKHHLY